MKESEFWLLTTVIELPVEVSFIMNPEELFSDLGRESHEFSFKEMAHAFHNLLQSGDIALEKDYLPPTIKEVPSTPQEWEAYMCHEDVLKDARAYELYYRLTEQGASRWEAIAKPNWDLNVILGGGNDDQGRNELFLSASNREVIETILNFYGTPISDTQVWEEISPWERTYWKTLEIGCRMRCSYVRHRNVNWIEEEYKILSSYCGEGWYTNPWRR